MSKAASDLISKSRRPNSNAHFESSWKKWASWCSRTETDSFSSSVNEIRTTSLTSRIPIQNY